MNFFSRQRSSAHSQFELNCESASAWVNQLPRANLAETGKQLLRALDELSTLECDFRRRLEVLEALRPGVSIVIRGLQPRYLNAANELPETSLAAVDLCNAFNQQLADNYQQVSRDILGRGWVSRYKLSLILSIHRELSERSQLLLRSYNLYQNEGDSYWERVHTCYRIANQFRLLSSRIIDNEYGHCTIERAYLRPLLFVCAHPYQLSREMQLKLHENLHKLCEHVVIRESDARKYSLMFDPAGNQAPIYQELCDNADGWMGIDTTELVDHIARQLEASDQRETTLPPALCRKLLRAWSHISDRIEQRSTDVQTLELAVGLSSTHFHIAQKQAIEVFTRGLEMGTVRRNDESWATTLEGHIAHDHIEPEEYSVEFINYATPHAESNDEKVREYRHLWVDAVNSSSEGYCISLPSTESNLLRNGDVVCVREADSPCWNVGSIGWIKQHSDVEIRAGIKILSHTAEPYVARPVGSGYVYRALLLSAERVSGKPASLLLPNVTLAPQTELELIQLGHRKRVHIGEQLQKTRHFALYSYALNKPEELTVDKVDEDKFDSAWNVI